MAGQLVFPFGVRPALGRESFVVAPCNEQAFRFVESWPEWPARAVAFFGPQGCGKTHLASIWCAIAKAPLIEAAGLTRDDVSTLGASPVAIEDADTGTDRSDERRDLLLMALLERPSGTILLTGLRSPSEWPVAVSDLRSRFDALLAFPMWAPDDTLLLGLVRKFFADRQLEVPPNVARRIVTLVERTPEAIAAFVARADRKALSEKRAVTERLVLDVIEAEEP